MLALPQEDNPAPYSSYPSTPRLHLSLLSKLLSIKYEIITSI